MFFLAAIPCRGEIEENNENDNYNENDNNIWKIKRCEQISILGRKRKKSTGVYSKRVREKKRNEENGRKKEVEINGEGNK